MSSITLDSRLGVNPRLTFCTMCGGDSNELALLGDRNYKRQCRNCECWNYGSTASDKCGKCKQQLHDGSKVMLDEHERLPSSSPCDDCQKLISAVKDGGVFWRCEDGCFGAIKKSKYADQVRLAHNIEAPEPCGVMYDADNCPNKENHKGGKA